MSSCRGDSLRPFNVLFLGLIISAARAAPGAKSNCPYPWVDATHVNLECIRIEAANLTWSEASSWCRYEQKGRLLEVFSPEQLDFVSMECAAIAHGSDIHFWVGALGLGEVGRWYWIESLSEVGEFVWGTGAPHSVYPENCMSLNPMEQHEYKAVDTECVYARGMICQRDVLSFVKPSLRKNSSMVLGRPSYISEPST